MSSDTRLIERWLPIAALGEESARERRSMTALPPTYYLHVWWARRPLIASRAAVLASLLPASADHGSFLRAIGIHGDPVASRVRIELAKRKGVRFEGDAYEYSRAFTYRMDEVDKRWLASFADLDACVLDPTAGGGSIPFEAARMGLTTIANDLNPVSALVLRSTIKYPIELGLPVLDEYTRISSEFVRVREQRLAYLYPKEPTPESYPTNYLWTRTVVCPYCDGVVPLAPNWKLNMVGLGIRLVPYLANGPGSPGRKCSFELVNSAKNQSQGTVSGGDATCPYSDCGRVIDGDDVKRQAQEGKLGEQLYAVVYKRRVKNKGKGPDKWLKEFRASRPDDDLSEALRVEVESHLPEWEALDVVPSEAIPSGYNTDQALRYGYRLWRDLFAPRQLICHAVSVQIYHELLEKERKKGELPESVTAAFVYLALALDKLIDRNSYMTRWIPQREVVANTFDSHDFSFKWTYAEVAFQVLDVGYDWAIRQVGKSIGELIELSRGDSAKRSKQKDKRQLRLSVTSDYVPPRLTITCKSGEGLDHLEDGSVDAIVMDPPYYNNVMYAELSDFFYVWLKRTAGRVVPDLFRLALTDKERDAVANVSRFRGEKGAAVLANRDYQERMAAIFAECRRVLKPSGLMTVMFTHRATGAWDALTKGLMQAGFTITASWPINTEAAGSLSIMLRSSAESTIFLVCRPRAEMADRETRYWEDIEPLVSEAVRERVKEFQDAGIGGVDLYLASFGPALQKFSENWPLRRGTPRPQPEVRKRKRQAEMFEEAWDPYEVTPEDALDAARREVKRWRLQQLTHMKARTDLDPLTSFYVLAWDAFRSPRFDYDEALRLARAVGVDLEKDIIGRVAEKKTSEIILWDSAKRAVKGSLGPVDGSRSWLDAVHHAAYAARSRNLQHAREMLQKAQVDTEQGFFAALEAVLEVLPVSKSFSGIDLEGDIQEFGSDFEALENLRKLAFANDVDEPQQLQLWKEEAEAAGVQ